MAELVKEGFVKKSARWKQWADGKVRRVKRGIDFDCEVVSFRSAIYQAALRLGMSAETSVDGDSITFRIFKPKPARKRA